MMNYNSLINQTALDIPPSGIRRFFDIAAEMEDVISLSVGEPDFPTPWHVRDVAVESLQKDAQAIRPTRDSPPYAGKSADITAAGSVYNMIIKKM